MPELLWEAFGTLRSSEATPLARRPTRYEVVQPGTLVAELWCTDIAPETTIRADVRDVSISGCRLFANEAVRLHGPIELTLLAPSVSFSTTVDAEVCWSRPDRNGALVLGCRFLKNIDPARLDVLAAAGTIERRVAHRHRVRIPLKVRRQLQQNEAGAMMVNISPGGFCFVSNLEVEVGEHLLVRRRLAPKSEAPVMVEAVWQRQIGDKLMTGCETTDSAAWNRLQNVAVRPPQSSAISDNRIGIAVCVLIPILFGLLVWCL